MFRLRAPRRGIGGVVALSVACDRTSDKVTAIVLGTSPLLTASSRPLLRELHAPKFAAVAKLSFPPHVMLLTVRA